MSMTNWHGARQDKICLDCRLLQAASARCVFCGSASLHAATEHADVLAADVPTEGFATAFEGEDRVGGLFRGCSIPLFLLFGGLVGFAVFFVSTSRIAGIVSAFICAVPLVLGFIRPWTKRSGPVKRRHLSEVIPALPELKNGRQSVTGWVQEHDGAPLPSWTESVERKKPQLVQRCLRRTPGKLALRLLAGKTLTIATSSGEKIVISDLASCMVESTGGSWLPALDTRQLARLGLPYLFDDQQETIAICGGDQIVVWADESLRPSGDGGDYRTWAGERGLGAIERAVVIRMICPGG